MELQNNYPVNHDDYIEFDQSEIEDYANGFNHASFLAEYAPEFLNEIAITMKGVNDFYMEGVSAGKEYYEREQVKAIELRELEGLRNKTYDRNFEREL